MLQYEREVADLRERVKSGEISGDKNVIEEFVKLLLNAMPKMSKKELRRLQATVLSIQTGLIESIASDSQFEAMTRSKPN